MIVFSYWRKQLLYLQGGSERHRATWGAPLAPSSKSLGCVCSFVWLSGLRGAAWPSCSALMPVGDRLDKKKSPVLRKTDACCICIEKFRRKTLKVLGLPKMKQTCKWTNEIFILCWSNYQWFPLLITT